MRAQSAAVDEDRARRRLVELAEQLDQRGLAGAVLADDGDHRAGRQRAASTSSSTSAVGAGVGERHVLEPDAVGEPVGHRLVGVGRRARRRSPRARPAAASRPARCRAGSRSRRRWRRCRPTAARPAASTSSTSPGGRVQARRPRTRRRRRRRRRRPPRRACARRRWPSGPRRPGRTSAPTPRGARRRARSPMPVTRTSLPGGAVVAMMNRWRASRSSGAPRSSALALDRRAATPRSARSAARTRRAGPAPGGSTSSRPTVTPSRRIQPQVENTDMYMWSSTKTWSRSTESRSR